MQEQLRATERHIVASEYSHTRIHLHRFLHVVGMPKGQGSGKFICLEIAQGHDPKEHVALALYSVFFGRDSDLHAGEFFTRPFHKDGMLDELIGDCRWWR